jgi:hypothetical protein
MPIRKAEAEWKGNFIEGAGRLRLGSGTFEGPYSFKSGIEEGRSATNPEELVGAAHAGRFTMDLTCSFREKASHLGAFTPSITSSWTKLDGVGIASGDVLHDRPDFCISGRSYDRARARGAW